MRSPSIIRLATLVFPVLIGCDKHCPPPIDICTQRISPEQLASTDEVALKSFHARVPGRHDRWTDLTILYHANWPHCSLRLTFLDGTNRLQKLVMEAAGEWHAATGVTFSPSDDANAEIRVSFSGTTNQSWVGRSGETVATGQPTLFLGGVAASDARSRILALARHELGHALGAPHEHQSPLANIHWNKPEVRAYYHAGPYHWNDAEIEANVFRQYGADEADQDHFDASSIMMYPIPKEWTTDGIHVENNVALSAEDERFMRQIYSACPPP